MVRITGILTDASMIACLKELEDKNHRPKKIYTEERLKAEITQQKSGEAIASQADGAGCRQKPKRQHTFACLLFIVSDSCYRYQPKLNEENF